MRKYLIHYWSTSKGVDPKKASICFLVNSTTHPLPRLGLNSEQALQGLPHGLRNDIMSHVCGDILARVPMFQSLIESDKGFMR